MNLNCRFAKAFLASLSEAIEADGTLEEAATTRTDRIGNKVEIPPGYSFDQGPDGVGVAIAPCARRMVDKVGRMHSVPKGYRLKIGKNGKGYVVAQGEPTRETKMGQIELLRKLNIP